jgi:hypothetical protein
VGRICDPEQQQTIPYDKTTPTMHLFDRNCNFQQGLARSKNWSPFLNALNVSSTAATGPEEERYLLCAS